MKTKLISTQDVSDLLAKDGKVRPNTSLTQGTYLADLGVSDPLDLAKKAADFFNVKVDVQTPGGTPWATVGDVIAAVNSAGGWAPKSVVVKKFAPPEKPAEKKVVATPIKVVAEEKTDKKV
jgi:hypothetical protein